MRTIRGGRALITTVAVSATTAPKPSSSNASPKAPYAAVRKAEMKMIGHNSPAIPLPSTPHQVEWRADRRRRGQARAGRAVVHSAIPTSHQVASSPPLKQPARQQGDRHRHHPANHAEPHRAPRHALLHHLDSGDEEDERQPEVCKHACVGIGVCEVRCLGADDDAEQHLNHNGGPNDPAVKPRQKCAESRGQ
ncbi:MAG TPA: hypothetical protein VE127_15850, partial [Solirubrobacteraceae bacterium]|nr:hypothetical protein [Solirubrobacteraceae bacterium]